jgi:HAD superfamily hydrolase (TIGR01509 family)
MHDSLSDHNPRAVLWDLDGTLADTMTCHFRAWREVLAGEGYALTWEAFAASFGQRNDTALSSMLGAELLPAEIERISAIKEERFRALVQEEGLQLLPGIASRLRTSRDAGWRQALVTSAPRANVETMLDVLGIGAFFGAVVTGDDVALGKPHPQPFLVAADALTVPTSRCIVVEDSPSGIEAARRAGMRSVAVGPAHASLPATLAAASLAGLPPDAFEALLADGHITTC